MKSNAWKPVAFVLFGGAAGWALSGWAERPAVTEGNDEVVARVGGVPLTMGEVAENAPQEFLQLAQQEYDLTEQYLDQAINTKIVELEAEARGMTPAELVKLEVDDHVSEPDSGEVAAFYRERSLASRGSLETLAPQIEDYLKRQSRISQYGSFLAGLADRYPAERLLEPPRVEVASDGFPAKGPKDAPVTIVEFADFQCPYCQRLAKTLNQVEEAYGDDVRLVYRQLPLPSLHPDAQRAAEASLCAREQGRFWEMHDAMFENQTALHEEGLKRTARVVGLKGEEFDACLESGTLAEEVTADVRVARDLGLTGTPAMFINGRYLNGYRAFEGVSKIIDDELRRAGYELEAPTERPRPHIAVDGFPSLGPADAPVIIVEFSDFQCPYCSQLVDPLKRLLQAYPDDLRFVYRQFPIAGLHPDAPKAAEASLCAEEQARFWEMHDAMFADQRSLSVDALKNTARTLGLNGAAFDSCLDSGRYASVVAADVQAGREVGVTGTPALFINGRMLTGVHTVEALSGVVDEELAAVAR